MTLITLTKYLGLLHCVSDNTDTKKKRRKNENLMAMADEMKRKEVRVMKVRTVKISLKIQSKLEHQVVVMKM